MAPITRSSRSKSSSSNDASSSSSNIPTPTTTTTITTTKSTKKNNNNKNNKNDDDDNGITAKIDDADDYDKMVKNILCTTKTIILVGASNKIERPSNEVMKILLDDYNYNVIPVNPNLAVSNTTIYGQQVVASISDIDFDTIIKTNDGSSDDANNNNDNNGIMVDIFRNSDAVGPIVDEIIEINNKYKKEMHKNNNKNKKDGLLISSIWMQIGVYNLEAAQKAKNSGIQQVVMNHTCPAEEIPRLFPDGSSPCPNAKEMGKNNSSSNKKNSNKTKEKKNNKKKNSAAATTTTTTTKKRKLK